jgi:hypothetical protein
VLVVTLLFLAACDTPDHAACLSACDAQNKCAGAKQTRCANLCNARPKDCTNEYTTYWTCAGTHLDEVCNALSGTCGDAFGKYSTCITAYCTVNPLDTNCYY